MCGCVCIARKTRVLRKHKAPLSPPPSLISSTQLACPQQQVNDQQGGQRIPHLRCSTRRFSCEQSKLARSSVVQVAVASYVDTIDTNGVSRTWWLATRVQSSIDNRQYGGRP
jgi:hypothetical protein